MAIVNFSSVYKLIQVLSKFSFCYACNRPKSFTKACILLCKCANCIFCRIKRVSVILYRYWPERSWNITFRWTAKRVIFSQGIINITILAPPTRDISSVPVDICYIRWSKWMISSKFYVLYDTTKFGNKTTSLRTKQLNAILTVLRAFYC